MLMAKIAALPISAVLADPTRRKHLIYERMAASEDPITREMGMQLRDGTVRVREMWAVPEYRRVLERGIRNLESFDLQEFNQQLDSAIADYERDRELDPQAADKNFRRYLEPPPESDQRRDER
jgi:hypothetical protein